MIAHASLPADDCARVARVLAAVLGGTALPFPPGGPDAWNVWAVDDGFQLVITPRGRVLVAGGDHAWTPVPDASSRFAESHVAIGTPRDARDVIALVTAAGWQARVCTRGGMFEVVEVWVENAYLVEVLDPDQLAAYRRVMTVATWRRVFGGARPAG